MEKELPLVEYDAEQKRLSCRVLVGGMVRDLMRSRELAWRLTVKDVSAQYRQSLLGIVWAFFPPIVTALIFVFLNSRNIVNIGETRIPYAVFAVCGTIFWQIFVYGLQAPLRVVSGARPMLTKINFPREALLLSCFWQSLFNAAVKLTILVPVFAVFSIPPTWGILWSLGAVALLILLGITLGLLLTPVGLLYTDVSQGLSLFTTLWFFATPVVYPPPSGLPFSLLATLNPVSPVLTAARDLATLGQLDSIGAVLAIAALTVALFCAAWIIYRLTMPILIERMSG